MNFNEKEVEKIIKDINKDFPKDQFMPETTFLQLIKPQLVKKSAQLEQARKKRLEAFIVAAAYIIAAIVIPCLVVDIMVNRFNGITGKYIFLILGFGLVMAVCLPIMIYFQKKSVKGMN